MSAGQGDQFRDHLPLLPYAQLLTSSSLYQESDSAVSTNQYSLEPPFIKLMLLMVSQPLRITWGRGLSLAGRTALLLHPPFPPQEGQRPSSVSTQHSQLGIRQGAGAAVGVDGDTVGEKSPAQGWNGELGL